MNALVFHIRRGILFSIAGLLGRVIPEQVFRMRYFVVFKLKDQHDDDREFPIMAKCIWCERNEELAAAEELSRFRQTHFDDPIRASVAQVYGMSVGSCWVAEHEFRERELGLQIKLTPSQRWLFGAMVQMKYRGLKLFPQLLRFTTSGLASENVREQFASVNPLNKASMSVFRSHSSEQIASVFAMRIFRFSICFGRGKVTINNPVTLDCNRKPIQLKFIN